MMGTSFMRCCYMEKFCQCKEDLRDEFPGEAKTLLGHGGIYRFQIFEYEYFSSISIKIILVPNQ